jgi:WD40 repeat protein
MNQHLRNIENITKLSEDAFSITYKSRTLHLTLNKQGETLHPKLYKELKVANLSLSDAKRHNVFKDCQTIDQVEEKLKQSLTQGKIDIVEDQGKYHLVLFDDISNFDEGHRHCLKEPVFIRDNQVCRNNISNNVAPVSEKLKHEFTNLIDLLKNEFLKPESLDELEKLILHCKKRRVDEFEDNNNNNNNIMKELNNQKPKVKFSAIKQNHQPLKTRDSIKSMFLLPNDHIAFGMGDCAQIYNLTTNSLQTQLDYKNVSGFVLMPDGDLVFMLFNSSKIFAFNNNCVSEMNLFKDIVNCLLVLKTGKLVVAEGLNINIVEKNNAQYKITKSFGSHRLPVKSLANFAEDQFISANVYQYQRLNIWDNNYNLRSLEISENIFSLLTLHGKYIIAHTSKNITIFNINQCTINCKSNCICYEKRAFHGSDVSTISLFQDYLLIGLSAGKNVEIWDVLGEIKYLYTIKGNAAVSTILVKENTLFVAYYDKTLITWEIRKLGN